MNKGPARTSVAALMARHATAAENMLITREFLGLSILKAPRRLPDLPGGA